MPKMSTDLIRHPLSGATMGTRWSAIVCAAADADTGALEVKLAAVVDRVDRQMSTWKPESDLMRFNAAPLGEWEQLPSELMFVLTRGLEVGHSSGGAFDIGLGDLVNAWGFGPAGKIPDEKTIQARLGQMRRPTFEILEQDIPGGRVRKHAHLNLDLSGIAKGYAVDEMMKVVKAHGIENALVGLDGELKASGSKPNGAPWVVAVEKPDYYSRSALGVIELRDAAIATSGNYRHWVDVGQNRLSHTMDRLRGGPSNSAVASVSVIAETCIDADAWATALLVLGEIEGVRLAIERRMDALFIVQTERGLIEIPVGVFTHVNPGT